MNLILKFYSILIFAYSQRLEFNKFDATCNLFLPWIVFPCTNDIYVDLFAISVLSSYRAKKSIGWYSEIYISIYGESLFFGWKGNFQIQRQPFWLIVYWIWGKIAGIVSSGNNVMCNSMKGYIQRIAY